MISIPEGVPIASIEGYMRAFQLEYWFRELVYLELKAHFGLSWWEVAQEALKIREGKGISVKVSQANDKKHTHMVTAETDPLWFLSFDALLKIVFDQKTWPYFEPYLTTKTLLEARFTEISPIRNRIAHGRILHVDDVARLQQLLRDLDHGFWRFCTSYSDTYRDNFKTDPVYKHFQESSQDIRVTVTNSRRPSLIKDPLAEKGNLYHFIFSTGFDNPRFHDYEEILKNTASVHSQIIYFVMDTLQRNLSVSIPAVIGRDAVLETAELIYASCANCYTTWTYCEKIKEGLGSKSRVTPQNYEIFQQPFAEIAAKWPHYVIPPGHAFAALDSGYSGSFFEA